VPSKLITKLRTLRLNTSLCNWILDFLAGCPQVVRVGIKTSTTLTLNTGAPQEYMHSPLLYSLFTRHYDTMCTTPNTNIKFADDTTVGGLITDVDETAYSRDGQLIGVWGPQKKAELIIRGCSGSWVSYFPAILLIFP
jgi:hypothetical protein